MTALQTVLNHYSLPASLHGNPFVMHPLQVDTVNELADYSRAGLYLDTGTGKTLVETLLALHRKIEQQLDTIVVIMPPLLVKQWAAWLKHITHRDGSPLRVTQYRGTPKDRKLLDLDVDFVLVGIQIFKLDYDHFVSHFSRKKYMVAVDEANMLSNIGTSNHEKVLEFSMGVSLDLMTGTPMNKPTDAYGLIKLVSPGLYRNYKHFENMHIKEVDFYGNPVEYDNLDMLSANLMQRSKRVLFEDMYPATEAPLFVPMPYDLDPSHYKLYKRLAEEQLLALPDGGKIDATTAGKMMHALGQIVVNYGHFAGDASKVSNALAMIQARLDEIQGKLVVFANYRMSIEAIVKHFKSAGAVAINGDVSPAQKAAAIEKFVTDPGCKIIVIHPKSGGFGVDGLQHVCHHALFIEPTQSPRDFHQCVARLKRTGQRRRVVVALPAAEGTLQVRGFSQLVENDRIANQVIRNAVDLKNAIFGL